MGNGTYIHNEQCPSCQTSGNDTRQDNLAVYTDGSFCFACGYHAGANIDKTVVKASEITRQKLDMPAKVANISKATYDAYNVTLEVRKDLLCLAFPYYDNNGNLATHKVRSLDSSGNLVRDFRFHKTTEERHVPLFGYKQLKETKHPVDVLLFEGERDLLTFHEKYGAQPGWCYLGLPGTQNVNNAAIALNDNDKVKSVYVVFDEDQAGGDAALQYKEVSTKLTKCNTFPLNKDVTDSIADIPDFGNFVSVYFVEKLVPYINKNAFQAFEEFRNSVYEPLIDFSAELPGLARLFRPRRGMFAIIAGDTGSGKSFFVDWLMLKAIENKKHVLLVSLEMTPGEVYTRLIYQLTGVFAAKGDINEELMQTIKKWCSAFDEYLHVSTHPEPTIDTVTQQLKIYGGDIAIVIVDTISLFTKSLEWQDLNKTSYALKALALMKIIGNPMVISVSQMSLKGKNKEKIGSSDVFGAASISHAPDFELFIDADTTQQEPFTLLKVIKRDRSAGEFGSVRVKFDFEAGNFYEISALHTNNEEMDF